MSLNQLKTNANMEKIQQLEPRKKRMLGGACVGAAVLILALLLGGGGSAGTEKLLGSHFPTDASKAEQCEYFANYEVASYQAVIDGLNENDIKELMRNDAKDLNEIPDIESAIEKRFYLQKMKVLENKALSNLASMLEKKDISDEKIEKQLNKTYRKTLNRCMGLAKATS